MRDFMAPARPHEMDFDVAGFEIDAYGRYDVADPDMLDVVAGGFRDTSRGGGGNSGCTANNNCGCRS